MGRYKDAFRPAREQSVEIGLAHRERQLAEIVAIKREESKA